MPFLIEQESHFIDKIGDFCQEKIEEGAKAKFYKTVVDNLDRIRHNYSAMQLYSPNISAQVAQKTRTTVSNFCYEFNLTETKKMLLQDGVGEVNFEDMYVVFKRMVVDNK